MDATWMRSGLMLGALAFAAGACSDDDPVDPSEEPPEFDAAELMAEMQQANYQENWEWWPEVGELYEVCCGHEGEQGAVDLLTVYLNDLAFNASQSGGIYPVRSTIVKEGYMAAEGEGDPTLAVITAMYKMEEGYNPDAGDWAWAMYTFPNGPNGDFEIARAGVVDGCIDCHDGFAAERDYVVGPQVGS